MKEDLRSKKPEINEAAKLAAALKASDVGASLATSRWGLAKPNPGNKKPGIPTTAAKRRGRHAHD